MYTINIERLSYTLQSQYSSLVTHTNNTTSTDKSLVYKALLSPLLDFDINSVAHILNKQFNMTQPIPLSSFVVNSNHCNNYCILFPRYNTASDRWYNSTRSI
jgi:hypothetical protein